MEPFVDYIHSKTAFLAFENACGQVALADLAMQPFAGAVANFEVGAESLNVFHHRAIEVGHSGLQAMGH